MSEERGADSPPQSGSSPTKGKREGQSEGRAIAEDTGWLADHKLVKSSPSDDEEAESGGACPGSLGSRLASVPIPSEAIPFSPSRKHAYLDLALLLPAKPQHSFSTPPHQDGTSVPEPLLGSHSLPPHPKRPTRL